MGFPAVSPLSCNLSEMACRWIQIVIFKPIFKSISKGNISSLSFILISCSEHQQNFAYASSEYNLHDNWRFKFNSVYTDFKNKKFNWLNKITIVS